MSNEFKSGDLVCKCQDPNLKVWRIESGSDESGYTISLPDGTTEHHDVRDIASVQHAAAYYMLTTAPERTIVIQEGE